MRMQHQRRRGLAKAELAPDHASSRVALFLAAATVSPLAVMVLAPAPAALPLIAFTSITGAALAALAAWSCGVEQKTGTLTLWDVSGGCALIGIGASVFSDTERILAVFARMVQ